MKLKGLIFLLLVAVGSSVFAQKRSLTELADEAFEAKQYVTAIDLYKKAYTKVKANRQEKNRIMFRQAECYRLMDDKKQAIKTYQRLVKAKYYTEQPKIFLYMADFQKFNSEWDAAEYNYKEYLKLVPDDALAKRRLESIALAKKWIENPTRHQIKKENLATKKESDKKSIEIEKLENQIKNLKSGKTLQDKNKIIENQKLIIKEKDETIEKQKKLILKIKQHKLHY